MIDAGWGRIVNLTSAASLHPPGPMNSAYGTAKVALNQFTRHLAAELAGTGVTANVLHPGDVKTEMWADIRDRAMAAGPAAEAYQQWVRWVEETGGDPPHKAVDAVLGLCDDAAAGISGQFCWIDDPLQAPIPSWDTVADARPWVSDGGRATAAERREPAISRGQVRSPSRTWSAVISSIVVTPIRAIVRRSSSSSHSSTRSTPSSPAAPRP